MQYLISVIDHQTGRATDAEMAAIDAFNQRHADRIVLLGGLAAPAESAVIDARGDQPLVTDGPFLEAVEYLAGLWVVESDSREAAIELAGEASHACGRRVELRPFL